MKLHTLKYKVTKVSTEESDDHRDRGEPRTLVIFEPYLGTRTEKPQLSTIKLTYKGKPMHEYGEIHELQIEPDKRERPKLAEAGDVIRDLKHALNRALDEDAEPHDQPYLANMREKADDMIKHLREFERRQ
jgi:hypothetical protein